jgi:hypothetical protein
MKTNATSMTSACVSVVAVADRFHEKHAEPVQIEYLLSDDEPADQKELERMTVSNEVSFFRA